MASKELNIRITATDDTRGVLKDIARQAREVDERVPPVRLGREDREIRRRLDRIHTGDRFWVQAEAGRRMRELGADRMEAFREAVRAYHEELGAIQENIRIIRADADARQQDVDRRRQAAADEYAHLSRQTRALLRQR